MELTQGRKQSSSAMYTPPQLDLNSLSPPLPSVSGTGTRADARSPPFRRGRRVPFCDGAGTSEPCAPVGGARVSYFIASSPHQLLAQSAPGRQKRGGCGFLASGLQASPVGKEWGPGHRATQTAGRCPQWPLPSSLASQGPVVIGFPWKWDPTRSGLAPRGLRAIYRP